MLVFIEPEVLPVEAAKGAGAELPDINQDGKMLVDQQRGNLAI